MGFLDFVINSLPVLGVPQCVFPVDSSAIQHESMNNSQAAQSEHCHTQNKILDRDEDSKYLVYALVILATLMWLSEERPMVALRAMLSLKVSLAMAQI